MVIINLKNLQVLVENIDFFICEDVKSYIKLIPCLMKYPSDSIVTVDDDILYTRDTIKCLVEANSKTPNAICCLNGSKFYKNGYACMYETWQRYKVETLGPNLIFPCGVGAVLYHLIHWILL